MLPAVWQAANAVNAKKMGKAPLRGLAEHTLRRWWESSARLRSQAIWEKAKCAVYRRNKSVQPVSGAHARW